MAMNQATKAQRQSDEGQVTASGLSDEGRELLERTLAEQGESALSSVPPLALQLRLADGCDPADPESLLDRNVLVGPVVNPLFDAAMLGLGARRLGTRTYSFSVGPDADPTTLEGVLDALPKTVVYAKKHAAEGDKNSFHSLKRFRIAYEASFPFCEGEAGAAIDRDVLVFDMSNDHPSDEPLAGSAIVASYGRGQLFLKVVTSRRMGTDVLSLPGYPELNLNLMRDGGVTDHLKVTPDTGVTLLETAADLGWPIADPGNVLATLRETVQTSVVAGRMPGSPGLARLSVGRQIGSVVDDSGASIKTGDFENPQTETPVSASVVTLSVKDAGAAIADARQRGMTAVLDRHIVDIVAMGKAQTVGREGLRPYQDFAVSLHLATAVGYVNACAPGLGKGHPVDTNVLTPTGWRRIGDLQIGDQVIGSDGSPTAVTGVFPKGELPVYRVAFSDGASVLCDGDHLWRVRHRKNLRSGGENWQTLSVDALLKRGLADLDGHARFRIPMTAPVQVDCGLPRPVPAYTLGVLLGDGCLTLANVKFHTDDPEIVAFVADDLGDGFEIKRQQDGDKCPEYRVITRPSGAPNPVKDGLVELGLWGKGAHEKSIPHAYLMAPVDERIALLQGLMDTDGSVTAADGHIEIGSCSEQLAEGVKVLVQSLGGTASIGRGPAFYYDEDGNRVQCRDRFRVSIQAPNDLPLFRLSRKVTARKPRLKYPPMRLMRSIEPEGRAQVVCIQVAAEDHLYVTEDYLVTHNTVMALAGMREKWLLASETSYQSLVVCPAPIRSQWRRETNKFFPEAHAVVLEAKDFARKLGKAAEDARRDDKPLVVICSYPAAVKGEAALTLAKWNDIACDEAAILKSVSSGRSKALWNIRMAHGASACALALTGTPIERSLDDMGRIVAWARGDDAMFQADSRLSRRFKVSAQTGVSDLWASIGPTVYRRDRSEIADELPDIDTEILVIDGVKAENDLANGARNLLADDLSDYDELTAQIAELDPADPRYKELRAAIMQRQGTAVSGITLARMACSDPGAIADSESPAAQRLRDMGLVEPAVKHGGTKRAQVVSLTADLVDNGEAVIMFTDFASVAKRLHADLEALGVKVGMFLGGMSDRKRDQQALDYQSGKLDVLILTKAGREGLNLQRTTVLIHFDLPWTPSEVIQRVGRASRFGAGKKQLTIYIPVLAGTIEERVAAVLVPRAITALMVLDAHRGVDAKQTEIGQAIGTLHEAVGAEEQAIAEADHGDVGMFDLAREVLV